MSEFREEMWKFLGKESFTNEDSNGIPALAQDNPRRIVIVVARMVIAPFINRSEDPDDTVSMTISDGEDIREIIEVPARKFKSKEKLLGLRLCRAFGLVDPDYRYNDINAAKLLDNPNSILFGDTVVEKGRGNQAMFPSRVLYSSSYSIRRKVDLTRKLTHNALSQEGTMWDRRGGEFRTSIFETEYVIPETIFPSFIVLKDPTPELFYHYIRTLAETTYGAQTSITGPNIRNEVIAMLVCTVEPPVSSYTVSKEIGQTEEGISTTAVMDKIKTTVLGNLHGYVSKNGGTLLEGEKLNGILHYFDSMSEKDIEALYQRLKTDTGSLYKFANFKEKKSRKSAKETDG